MYRSSPSFSTGRLPRTSVPLLLTTSAPLRTESCGANVRPNGLRMPHANGSRPVPSWFMRMTDDVHGLAPFTTWPGVAAVPNGRYGPVVVVAFGSEDRMFLLVKFAPVSVTSEHGTSWSSGCFFSHPVTSSLSTPTTALLVALPWPQ